MTPMSTRRKLLLLGSLYLAQGLPFGFFTQALPVLLREMGTSLQDIGLASLLALPWALKFLWAPVVDRTGTRRRWILALQGGAIALAVVLALANPDAPGGAWVLLAAVLLTNLFAATQDVATDGLAVTLLSHRERGLGNGIQVGGYRVGMILGGGLLLVLFDHLGWAPTLLAMAGLLALSTVPLWRTPPHTLPDADAPPGLLAPREPTPANPFDTTAAPPPPANPWSWVQLRGALPFAAVLVAFKVGDYLAGGMLRPFLVDAGLSKTDIGLLLGTGGFVAGLLGAVVGGALVTPVGRVRALVTFGLLQATGVAAYAVIVAGAHTGALLWAATVYEHFVGGLATAALFTAMMDASRTEHAGTDYTLQASIVVIASLAASTVSGIVAEAIGYPALFRLGAILALAGPLLAAVPACTAITRAVATRAPEAAP